MSEPNIVELKAEDMELGLWYNHAQFGDIMKVHSGWLYSVWGKTATFIPDPTHETVWKVQEE